jgi:3-oxoacyl-[acyl-carrier protein] reductase
MPTPATPPAALVSGASRGLGAVISRRLAGDGFAVAVTYRSDRAGAQGVVSAIRAAGGTSEAFQADVTDEESVDRLAHEVRRRLGPIRALVISATGPQPTVPIEELTWQTHLDQLLYFVKSPTLLLKAFLGDLKSHGRHGRVVQIGSDAFERASPNTSAYTAAKGAQLGLTRSWARELGPHGVTVNLVAPGWIPVERHADADPASLERYQGAVPLRRLGVPNDIASAVSFLASEQAGFVTGERVTVNGGHTID